MATTVKCNICNQLVFENHSHMVLDKATNDMRLCGSWIDQLIDKSLETGRPTYVPYSSSLADKIIALGDDYTVNNFNVEISGTRNGKLWNVYMRRHERDTSDG